MGEEYLLIKKTTYDRMKSKVETHDQGVNTEENDSPSPETPPQTETLQNPLDREYPSDQSGSGLTYVRKEEFGFTPGHAHSEEKTDVAQVLNIFNTMMIYSYNAMYMTKNTITMQCT
jgi:hypothetical protein